MNLEEKLRELESPQRTPVEAAARVLRPVGEDIMLSSRSGHAGVHVREDDAVELYARGGRILLSSDNSACGLLASRVYLIGHDIRLAADHQLSIDGHVLDHWYFSDDSINPRSPDRFVLVPKDETSLSRPISQGDVLGSFVEKRPLFRHARPLEQSEVGFIKLLWEGML